MTIASCSPLNKMGYVTPTHNMPMMSRTFDGHAMATAGFNHFELQGAFSPIKHVAVLGNLYKGFGGKSEWSKEWGGGLYHAFDDRFIVEAFYLRNDASIYRAKNRVLSMFLSEHVDYRKESLKSVYDGHSLQMDVGYKWYGEYADETTFTAALGVKWSEVVFREFSYKYKLYGDWGLSSQYVKEEYEVLMTKEALSFLAISGTFKYGTGGLRAIFQYSHHLGLSGFGPSQSEPPYYQPAWITIGLEAYIPNLKRHRR
ncbi:MAG: hypothetical protein RL220_1139 [Bacteroidota bacterium]